MTNKSSQKFRFFLKLLCSSSCSVSSYQQITPTVNNSLTVTTPEVKLCTVTHLFFISGTIASICNCQSSFNTVRLSVCHEIQIPALKMTFMSGMKQYLCIYICRNLCVFNEISLLDDEFTCRESLSYSCLELRVVKRNSRRCCWFLLSDTTSCRSRTVLPPVTADIW